MVARSPRVSAVAPSPKNSSQAPTTFCLRRNSVSASTMSVAVMPGCSLPVSSTPTISGRAHPRRAAQHHALRFQATDADGDHAQRIDVRGVAVGADAGVGEGHAVTHLDHRRHFLQVDLVHDAVARRDHIHVLERLLGPVDEVETVFVATIFDGAVLGERVRIEATAFHGQRVVDDQLRRHHRIDLRRVAALLGDGVAQAGKVDQRGLAENVVAHHAGREPREIEIASCVRSIASAIRSAWPGRSGAPGFPPARGRCTAECRRRRAGSPRPPHAYRSNPDWCRARVCGIRCSWLAVLFQRRGWPIGAVGQALAKQKTACRLR